MEVINEEVQAVRAARAEIRKRFLAIGATRYNLLAYAFVRGKTHEFCEQRVSEHNLPSAALLQQAINRLLNNDEKNKFLWEQKPTPETTAWLKMPEERIKRFGPRVPKMRKSTHRDKAAE